MAEVQAGPAPAAEPAAAAPRAAVTLLFGLPFTVEDYLARFDAGSGPSDFLAKYDDPTLGGEARKAARMYWWTSRYEENVARPLAQIAAEAAKLGYPVRQRATLDDLSMAARDDAVVILITHWKGPEFSNDDFVPGSIQAVPALLQSIDHPLAATLLDFLRGRCSWLPFFGRKPMPFRETLRRCLDVELQEHQAGDVHYELKATRHARRRALLDVWLKDHIRPGNRLELFDGMHGAAEVAQALSPGFKGVMDLTICTSTYLGDHLGHAAAQRFRTVQFPEEQESFETLLRVSLVLNLYAQSQLTYLAARSVVNEAYTKVIQDMSRNIPEKTK